MDVEKESARKLIVEGLLATSTKYNLLTYDGHNHPIVFVLTVLKWRSFFFDWIDSSKKDLVNIVILSGECC